jgi:hypothetical protein
MYLTDPKLRTCARKASAPDATGIDLAVLAIMDIPFRFLFAFFIGKHPEITRALSETSRQEIATRDSWLKSVPPAPFPNKVEKRLLERH